MATILSAATRQPLSDMTSDADLCADLLDEATVAYLAGAGSVAEYRQWLSGGETDRLRTAPRLAAVRRVLLAFDAENRLPLAEAWLREVDATGDTPARLIRDKGDDEKVGAVVAEAAEQWLKRRPAGREVGG